MFLKFRGNELLSVYNGPAHENALKDVKDKHVVSVIDEHGARLLEDFPDNWVKVEEKDFKAFEDWKVKRAEAIKAKNAVASQLPNNKVPANPPG